MRSEIRVPKIREGEKKKGVIIRWYREDGDRVKKDEEIAEVMIEKLTLHITAPEDGILTIFTRENEEIEEDSTIGFVETE